jgi:hypothetical protein
VGRSNTIDGGTIRAKGDKADPGGAEGGGGGGGGGAGQRPSLKVQQAAAGEASPEQALEQGHAQRLRAGSESEVLGQPSRRRAQSLTPRGGGGGGGGAIHLGRRKSSQGGFQHHSQQAAAGQQPQLPPVPVEAMGAVFGQGAAGELPPLDPIADEDGGAGPPPAGDPALRKAKSEPHGAASSPGAGAGSAAAAAGGGAVAIDVRRPSSCSGGGGGHLSDGVSPGQRARADSSSAAGRKTSYDVTAGLMGAPFTGFGMIAYERAVHAVYGDKASPQCSPRLDPRDGGDGGGGGGERASPLALPAPHGLSPPLPVLHPTLSPAVPGQALQTTSSPLHSPLHATAGSGNKAQKVPLSPMRESAEEDAMSPNPSPRGKGKRGGRPSFSGGEAPVAAMAAMDAEEATDPASDDVREEASV